MKTSNENAAEMLFKTSELLNSVSQGFKNDFQVIKLKIRPNRNKETEVGLQNVSNWFANRFLSHYGGLRINLSANEVIYYFCISNTLCELLDAKKLLIKATRFTFDSVEIVPIVAGTESVVVNDFTSLLAVQTDILLTLSQRYKTEGKKSWSILCDKLPPIAVRKSLYIEI